MVGSLVVVTQKTRHGLARLHISTVAEPEFVVILHHGAGGGVESKDLRYIAEHCATGHVVRVEQPWRVSGKKIAPAPRILDEVALELEYPYSDLPVILGGRSAGARVACRTASALSAQALLLLAFPLHPPGRPDRSRAVELNTALPTVVLQGDRDPFGRPEEFPVIPLIPIPGTGHELAEIPLDRALALLGFAPRE